MASAPISDNRQAPRIAADVVMSLRRHGQAALDVRLIDVSAGGAMLAVDAAMATGEALLLSARGLDVAGVVVWANDGRCGVSFVRRLQLGEVALLARRGRRPLVANG